MSQSTLPLHEAIWKNDEGTVLRYLEKGEGLNAKDEKDLKPLHIAIITSNEKIVKYLLSDETKEVIIDSKAWCCLTSVRNEKIVSLLVEHYDGKSIENPEEDLSPLHHAVINRNARFINLFCALGCRVNRCSNNGFTPLHFAALANDLESINCLLNNGAATNTKTVDGKTPMYFAVRHRYTESVSLLMKKGGVGVDDIVDNSGSSSLHIAVQNNDECMIKLLLENNANLACKDHSDRNLLHLAAQHGHEKLVKLFINSGIDINAITKDHSTPLLIALRNNHQNVAAILLDNKADVNLRDNMNLSPLCAALEHNNVGLAERLVSLGADVNNITLKNSSVLHFAAKYSDKNMISHLVRSGAKLGMKDYLGQNELHIAAKYNSSDVLQYLLKLGMKINEVTSDRSTALHCVVSSKMPSVNNVRTLASHGIVIDAENESGDTALNIISRAIPSHRNSIMEYLLKVKADPNHMGSDKRMPLYTSLGNDGNLDTARLLIKYGACMDKVNSLGDSIIQLLIKLSIGCACSRSGLIKEFLKLGADINHANENGETALHTSFMHENYELSFEIDFLTKMGARMTTNKFGESLLHVAIKFSSNKSTVIESIVQLLLNRNVDLYNITADGSNIIHYVAQYSNNSTVIKTLLTITKHRLINGKNSNGKTPLHLAAALGSNGLVEVLLDHDAEIDSKDNNKDSAVNHAIIGKHIETVKLLLKRGASTTTKNKDGFSAYDLAEQKDRHIYQLLLSR